MTELFATLNDFLKEQLKIHGAEVWFALIFLGAGNVCIWAGVSIVKGFLKAVKHFKLYDTFVRLASLALGVAFMFGYGALFTNYFTAKQKIIAGLGMGLLNIGIYHFRKWQEARKKKNG
jgi:hypothetical protein